MLFAGIAFALNGHTKILALSEKGDEKKGVSADLFLEIKSGSGRVFLETYPLSQIATQVSMRFAQQIACQELDIDCSVYDFFFTIKAPPGVIGGPSAGAAASLLTGILLKGLDSNKNISITGTINSGGLIGPVGGLKEKIEGAGRESIDTVLIPKGTRMQKEGNISIDLVEFGKTVNVDVHEVASFEDSLFFFNGVEKKQENSALNIDERYQHMMKLIAKDLCERSGLLINAVEVNANNSVEIKNLTMAAKDEFVKGNFYSSASFCFRSNIASKKLFFAQKNYSEEELSAYLEKLVENLNSFEKKVNQKNINTLTDLETYMAVKERIHESRDLLLEVVQKLNSTNAVYDEMAYLEERIYSAGAWSKFFDVKDSGRYNLDEERLKQSCANKIAEAEERYSYVNSYIPALLLNSVKKDLDKAYSEWNGKNYIMCLYDASKAKAQTNLLLSVSGIEPEFFDDVLDVKIKSVEKSIHRAQEKGIFPLLSYYYYQYGSSLKARDKGMALLFLEYSLELSNIDIYFEKHSIKKYLNFSKEFVYFLAGVLFGMIVFRSRKKKEKECYSIGKEVD